MKKLTFSLLVAVLVSSIAYSPVRAITAETDQAKFIADLMAQIADLQAKIKKLQEQQGNVGDAKKEKIKECLAFGMNLKIGDRGPEVARLAKILGKEKKMDGQAAEVFTEDIAAAVSQFQEEHASEILKPAGLKAGTGFLGARTRAKLNKMYGCGNGKYEVKKQSEKKGEAMSQITITLQDGISQADAEKLLAGYGLKMKIWTSSNGGIVIVPAGLEQKYVDKLTTYYPEKIKSASIGN